MLPPSRRLGGLVAHVLGGGRAATVKTLPAAGEDDAFKVYVSVDIEGVAGVVNPEHLGPTGFEYGKACDWMTAEAVCAAEAALEAGATSVVLSDSHGNGCNIHPDALPPHCRLVRSWPRELGMMAGIDSSFAAALLVGYHPGTQSLGGVRAHTFSSASLTSVKINGREESEVGISALVAGELGVPVIMASGDDMLAEEIAGTLGPLVEVAVVKEALSYHSANTMRPEDAQALVKTTAARSLERLKAGDHSPLYTTDTPITLDISTKNCARVFCCTAQCAS